MIVKPICAAYDVNRKFGFNATEAITIEHEEDFKTRFIDLFLYENNIKNAVDVSGATVTARMVTTPEFDSLLLNDNVSCSIGEKQGHIVVPIDKAVLPSYPCEFLVEIHIENGEDVLVLPFPLWVKMNASILDDAGVTPESKGTVPELLEEATQALEAAEQAISTSKEYTDAKFNSLKSSVDSELDSLDEAKANRSEVYTKAAADDKFEVKANKVTEITPQALSVDNVRYPSVTAARNYTNSKYNDLDGRIDTISAYHYDSVDVNYTINEYHYCDSSGRILGSDYYNCTDDFYITNFSKLVITSKYGGSQAGLIAFFDDEDNIVGYINDQQTLAAVTKEIDLSSYKSDGAVKAIVNCARSATEFKISGVRDVTIEDKLKQVSDDVDALDELKGNVYTKTEVDAKISESEKYDYDGTEQPIDYSLDDAYEFCDKNGRFIENSSYRHTDYFDIRDYDKLKLSTIYGLAAVLVAFFDNANAFIGYFNDSASATVTVTDKVVDISSFKNNGAVKAIVNCANAYIDSLSIKGISIIDITIEDKLKQVADDTTVLNTLKGKKLFVGGDSIMYGRGSGGYAIGEYLRDKYSMVLTKGAVTGATLSTSFDNSICTRMAALTGDFDVIIFDGGVNDKSKGYELGTITNKFEDNFDTTKVIGALEKICRYLVLNYPRAIKLFVISNEMTTSTYATNKPQIEYMEALIPVLNKWGIPYVNMLHTSIKAFNEDYNNTYFYQSDKLHPNSLGYETFYFGKIEQALLFGSTDSTTAKKETSISGANIRLSSTNYVYDGSSHVPNVSAVTLNGQTLTPNVDYAVISAPATNAGDYVITINGMGSYSGTATANWTISKAQATISGDDSISIIGVGNSLTKTYTTNGDGTFSFSASGGIATTSNIGGTVTVTSTEIGNGTMTVSVSEGQNYLGATKDVELTIVSVDTAKVFGVMWDYSLSSPELTRLTPQTDPLSVVTTVPEQEPAACIGNDGNGQSDFDNYFPWKGMQRYNYVDGQITDFVSYENGETYVYIPNFWSKIVNDSANERMYFYISDSELAEFTKHPGSGKYMSRYECNSSFLSAPGSTPKVNANLGDFRNSITAIDDRHYQYDIHTYNALELLYIVEFANLNTQAAIGAGITSGGALPIGETDILAYHTGRINGAADNVSAIQYRWIENLWGNVTTWVDGILIRNGLVYICNDRTKYDSSTINNYESTEIHTPTNNGWHKTDQNYNNCYLIAFSVGGSDSTYTCDSFYYGVGVRGLNVGGSYRFDSGSGLFWWDGSAAPNNAVDGLGGRPILILNNGGNG